MIRQPRREGFAFSLESRVLQNMLLLLQKRNGVGYLLHVEWTNQPKIRYGNSKLDMQAKKKRCFFPKKKSSLQTMGLPPDRLGSGKASHHFSKAYIKLSEAHAPAGPKRSSKEHSNTPRSSGTPDSAPVSPHVFSWTATRLVVLRIASNHRRNCLKRTPGESFPLWSWAPSLWTPTRGLSD